jgi:hypothetical protein
MYGRKNGSWQQVVSGGSSGSSGLLIKEYNTIINSNATGLVFTSGLNAVDNLDGTVSVSVTGAFIDAGNIGNLGEAIPNYLVAGNNISITTSGGLTTISSNSNVGGNGYVTTYTNVNSISGTTFTFSGVDTVYDLLLSGVAGTCYINAPTNMQEGSTIVLKIKQDAGGGKSVVFVDDNINNITWKFPNGNPPVITSSANAEDILTIIRIKNGLYTTTVSNFS